MNQRRASPTLPLELVVDILARLHVRTIISCKCVCKSWLSLINSDEFAKFHLSKSVPSLSISMSRTRDCTLYEIEDGLDLELRLNHVAKVSLPNRGKLSLCGSANGLLFLLDIMPFKGDFFHICNPITREYVQLPYPKSASSTKYPIAYGFGASRITGQLKMVNIFERKNHQFEFPCEVHTLGTGSWRRVAYAAAGKPRCRKMCGSILNGNLHWLMKGLNGTSSWISCFDLETELFSIISTPSLNCRTGLGTLGSYLCLCENTGNDIVIWLMKEYGIEKSWTKEFVISNCSQIREFRGTITVYPFRILNDDVVLRTGSKRFLMRYSKKNGRILMQRPKANGTNQVTACRILFLHTPSFVSLKSLGMENVGSF